MASIVDTLPVTTQWNERAVIFQATRMLMGERKSPERVAEFLAHIAPLVDEASAKGE